MDMDPMLQQTGAVEAISRELGIDSATAKAGATALLPSSHSRQQPLGGALGGILGGQSKPSSEQAEVPSISGGILDDLIGAASKYLER